MTEHHDWLRHEWAAREKGYVTLCGIDEAGRGPLAGPVFAAAVVLSGEDFPAGLNDSKKLTAKKREVLYPQIIQSAQAYGIASASVEEIAELNILNATFLAMARAVEALGLPCDCALVDGDKIPPTLSIPSIAVIGGDAQSASIAAASVLAKVSRDRYMLEMAERYPAYAFEKHKGYGTKLHVERILAHGPCEIHRVLFLRKILEKRA